MTLRMQAPLRAFTKSGEAGPTPKSRIALTKAIRGLPPTPRTVLHLFYREEISVEEIPWMR